ncbi:MAG: nuclear transport factor 2 family protein [Caldilineaceae bacterium]|nr:nuclear transport factor 2 family protein [Caldilineaceae bacterium]
MAKRRNRQGRRLAAICFLGGLWLAGCSAPLRALPTPTPIPPTPAFAAAPAVQALPALVIAERQAAATGDLAILAQLWAADARIVDGRGTSDSADDYVWTGRAAILDRYRLAVFPSPPPPLGANDLQTATVHLEGDQATLVRNGDRWRFTQRDGRWWLLELTYN